MHHPKEAVIDGVKFVLIPEELFKQMEWALIVANNDGIVEAGLALEKADEYFPEG